MPFRPEADAAIGAEASRKPTNTIGWGADIDKLGQSPNIKCTVYNDDGFQFVFVVLDSEELSTDEVFQQCLHDTIAEVRKRRHGP